MLTQSQQPIARQNMQSMHISKWENKSAQLEVASPMLVLSITLMERRSLTQKTKATDILHNPSLKTVMIDLPPTL
jgi:hypothetical protein